MAFGPNARNREPISFDSSGAGNRPCSSAAATSAPSPVRWPRPRSELSNPEKSLTATLPGVFPREEPADRFRYASLARGWTRSQMPRPA